MVPTEDGWHVSNNGWDGAVPASATLIWARTGRDIHASGHLADVALKAGWNDARRSFIRLVEANLAYVDPGIVVPAIGNDSN